MQNSQDLTHPIRKERRIGRTASDTTSQADLPKHKFFTADLWQRDGGDAWMRPRKAICSRHSEAKREIVTELRKITGRVARFPVPIILEYIADAEGAKTDCRPRSTFQP